MATLLLWVGAVVLGYMVFRRYGLAEGVRTTRAATIRALQVMPRIIVAVLTAGFVGMLVPSGLVAEQIGPESGLRGVIIAMLVGGVIPAGPMISFPLVVVLNEAGAGQVQLITLLTAWSVFAMHRVIMYEIPLMGLRFGATRLAASLPLPLIAAGLATLIRMVAP
ncbi:hypothetical protein HDIA_4234 [Hartmannibacter diazotrophicus]|uniref:Permease n=1 Tax=Hartmannibacter diazotrophicus TaxID=1482074 RepID=A0A2C9DDT0_9HYPH|nr:hypothetical protein [Hartmannibacter diazotrophicus]SON57775.1 hypothetical protein HDIA_4234 [Hartmannibacter diazotrophicus]